MAARQESPAVGAEGQGPTAILVRARVAPDPFVRPGLALDDRQVTGIMGHGEPQVPLLPAPGRQVDPEHAVKIGRGLPPFSELQGLGQPEQPGAHLALLAQRESLVQ